MSDIENLAETESMISFDIKVNDLVVTRFRAVWQRSLSDTDSAYPVGIYKWESWRPQPGDGFSPAQLAAYMTGEVSHHREDGAEILTLNILEDWGIQKLQARYEASPSGQLDREFAARRTQETQAMEDSLRERITDG